MKELLMNYRLVPFSFIFLMILGLVATALEAFVKSKAFLHYLERGFLWLGRLYLISFFVWLLTYSYLTP